MVQDLEALTVLADDQTLVPRMYVKCLNQPVTPAAGDIMHLAPDAPVLMWTYTCTIKILKNTLKNPVWQASYLAKEIPKRKVASP